MSTPGRSPWLFAFAGKVARIDVWASGAAIAAVSIAALVAFSDWEEWLNLLLGLWLTVSPWVLGFTHTKAMHVSIGLGAMVAFVAGLELWLVKYAPNIVRGSARIVRGRAKRSCLPGRWAFDATAFLAAVQGIVTRKLNDFAGQRVVAPLRNFASGLGLRLP